MKPSDLTLVLERWLQTDRPAVVFDFNGTLSDDEPILFAIFCELFSTHLGWAMTQQDYDEHLLGRSDREIIEYAVTNHGAGDAAQVERLLELRHGWYQRRVADNNPITEEALGLVETIVAQGIPVAIVTGAQRVDVLAVLGSSPAGPLIEFVIAEEDVTVGKPHPEGYLGAAARLDRAPSDVLVFEDSVPGVQAALAAGMHCVAVSANPMPALIDVAPVVVPALGPGLLADALRDWATR